MADHDLTLVGLTDDQQRLVLVSDAGVEFTLPADARLRAALRGEHARLGQLEITMESALRPRDIQARIRSGETPEQVAAAAQTPLDKVMTYASPVLAERAHVADRAQRASVRRKAGDGPARVLAEAVAERLRGRNLDPASVEWDAWRREDGRWTLVADYRSGERARHAEFVFDAPGRYVLAEDDEARWLVGEPTASKGPQPRATPGPRRLNPVVGDDVELPLGEDAIELVSDYPPSARGGVDGPDDGASDHDPAPDPDSDRALHPADVGVDGPTAGWTRANERPTDPDHGSEHARLDVGGDPADGPADGAANDLPHDLGDDDPVAHPVELGSEADGDLGDDRARDDAGPGTDAPIDPATDAPVDPASDTSPDTGADESGADESGADETGDLPAAEEPGTPRRSPRKNRRPSVPSWDEIMFGGGKQD